MATIKDNKDEIVLIEQTEKDDKQSSDVPVLLLFKVVILVAIVVIIGILIYVIYSSVAKKETTKQASQPQTNEQDERIKILEKELIEANEDKNMLATNLNNLSRKYNAVVEELKATEPPHFDLEAEQFKLVDSNDPESVKKMTKSEKIKAFVNRPRQTPVEIEEEKKKRVEEVQKEEKRKTKKELKNTFKKGEFNGTADTAARLENEAPKLEDLTNIVECGSDHSKKYSSSDSESED
jgi:hypothetical protein